MTTLRGIYPQKVTSYAGKTEFIDDAPQIPGAQKTPYRQITWGALVTKADPKRLREPQYVFSNKRTFY